MDMMESSFKMSSCVAAKILRAKTEKLDRQSHLCRLTKLNFCTYIHSNNILGELFLVQSCGLMSAFQKQLVIENNCKEKGVKNTNITTIQDEF